MRISAYDHLRKPRHTPNLLAALDQANPAARIPGPAASHEKRDDDASLPALDIDDPLKRMDGDRDLWNELLQLVTEEWPKNKAEMQSALDKADCTLFQRLAHSLRGASANLGALRLSRAACELEKLAKPDQMERARQQWEAVKSEAAAALSEIDSLLREVAP
jgi:HPt (histidine-containing phosphotransfer) domain-containing protein